MRFFAGKVYLPMRRFLFLLSLLALTLPLMAQPLFRIGLIADVQYCDCPPKNQRYYRLAPSKLVTAVADLNQEPLDFVVDLGDRIDRDWESFDRIDSIYLGLHHPLYRVLGNHDYDVADSLKPHVPTRAGVPGRYYRLAYQGWRFLFLDGNAVSTYAHPAASPETAAAEAELARLEASGHPGAKPWNGGIDAPQLAWLEAELEAAKAAAEPVLLFCHFPLYPTEQHTLWNDGTLIELLARFPQQVVAWINGHNHAGNYGHERGIHFLTVEGMLDTPDTNAFGVLEIWPDRLEVKGRGRVPDRVMARH
jgi:manganese-dependent ADP-ribose/CDP-alcohol diphosphatase